MQYGGKQWVGVDFPPIFGEDKALILSVANSKFRMAFMSKVSMNGEMNWDYKNKNGLNLSFTDARRFLMMVKTMIQIYINSTYHPDKCKDNPMYNATHLTMPILSSSGVPYGHVAVGTEKNQSGETAFWIGFKTQSNEGTVVQEIFHFRNASGKGGEINFFADGGPGGENNPIASQTLKYSEFINFVNWLEFLVTRGPYVFAQESNAYYRGNRSYVKKDNRQPHSDSGAYPDPESNNSFSSDIPF